MIFKMKFTLLSCIVLCFFVGTSQQPAAFPSAANSFAFWYDVWEPGVTIDKVRPANVVIGVPGKAVPEIHATGRRALQYVTYYQSTFHHPFLKDRQDLPNVGFQVNGEFQK